MPHTQHFNASQAVIGSAHKGSAHTPDTKHSCDISNKPLQEPCLKNGKVWNSFFDYCDENKDDGWEVGCRYPCE